MGNTRNKENKTDPKICLHIIRIPDDKNSLIDMANI